MNYLLRTIIVTLVLLPSLGHAQAVESIAGLWFGEGHQPEMKMDMAWVVERRDDGTFTFDVRRYLDCKLVYKQVEKGRWKQTGMQYLTTTESIEGIPFEAEDEYRIEEITKTEMKYVHLKSNTKFEARRISPSVGFPMPSRCSI